MAAPCIKRDGRYLCELKYSSKEMKTRKKYHFYRNRNYISFADALKANPDFKFCPDCSKVFFQKISNSTIQIS